MSKRIFFGNVTHSTYTTGRKEETRKGPKDNFKQETGYSKRSSGLGRWTPPKHAPLMRVQARIGGVWATVVVYTENTGVFMGETFAGKLGRSQVFAVKEGYENRINQADGSWMKETGKVAKTVIKVRKERTMELEADVLELGGRDLIVGMAWLIKEEAVIDYKQYTITFPNKEQWNCELVPFPTVEDGT